MAVAMTILNNTAVQMTLGELNKNISETGKRLSKLALGEKITHAGDDASNYAISEKMRVRLRALNQDSQNVQNGKALLNVAENGIQQQIEMLKTLREKVIDASNDHNSEIDRATIQKEWDQYLDQIEQTAYYTEYNEIKVLIGDTWISELGDIYEVKGAPVSIEGSDGMDVIPNIYGVLDGYTGPFDIFDEFDQYIQELPGIIEDYNPEVSLSPYKIDDYYDENYVYGDHALSFYAHLYGGKDSAPVTISATENYSGMDYSSLFPDITDSNFKSELNGKTISIGGRDYVFTTDAYKDYRNDSTGQVLPKINLNSITSRAGLLQTVANLASVPYTTGSTASTTRTIYDYPDADDFDNSVDPPTLSADYLSSLDESLASYNNTRTASSSDWLSKSDASGTETHDVQAYHIDERKIYHPATPERTISHAEVVSISGYQSAGVQTVSGTFTDNSALNGNFSGGKDGHGRVHKNFTDPDAALSQPEKATLDFTDVSLSEGDYFVLNGATTAVYSFVNDASGVVYKGKHQSTDGKTSTAYFTIGLQSQFTDFSLSGGGQNVGVHLTKTNNGGGKYSLHFESDLAGEQYNSYNIRSYPGGKYDYSETTEVFEPVYVTIPAWTETIPATAEYYDIIPEQNWTIASDYYSCEPYGNIGDFGYTITGTATANTVGAGADQKATYVINTSSVTDSASMEKFFKGIAGKGLTYCNS